MGQGDVIAADEQVRDTSDTDAPPLPAPGPDARGRAGWRLIGSQMWRQKRGLIAGISIGLLWTVGRVTIPSLVQMAIDRGIERSDAAVAGRWALVIGIVATITALLTGVRRYLAFREARHAEAQLRNRLFAHLVRLSFAYHDRAQTGQLMSRANTDLQQVQNFIVLVPLTLANLVTILATAVILVRINLVLAVLAMGALPLVNWLAKQFSTRLYPVMMTVQQESAELAAVVEETVAGVRVVKGFGAESVQAARLSVEADDVYEASMESARIRARYWPGLDLLPSIGLILVLAYGGHLVLDGELTIGELVAFNAYVTLLVWPLRMLGWIVAMAQRAVAAAERVAEVLATEPHVEEPRRPQHLPARPVRASDGRAGAGLGAVRIDAVRFAYGPGAPILDDLTLEIPAGQSVALVGGTGGGKSTVARVLCRFYDVDEGSIEIDGVDIRRVGLEELRRAVGIVFEETFLFSDSIAANIAFSDPDADMTLVERAARLAGAHDFVTRLPDGYDTVIGERGYSLSGGQRQRIAIARAILADPRVLILDDATSAVDPTKEHEIRGALGEVMQGRTTLVIAHRPATIALADRVVLLDGGRIVADGTHEELLATDARYRQVLASVDASSNGGPVR